MHQMKLLFDLWVLHPEKIKEASPEEELVFETIWNFVHDRIYILDKEIGMEEELYKENDPCILIEIIKKRLSFNGYSDELTEKLKSCFTENDEKILAMRFEEAFSYLN